MGHLKLKDGTTFPLNLSVGDIRDISKRSGAFSKTVTLVGDDDNNNLLNHYYDVNVQAGTFDINKLEQCQVIQNGIVILDNAYMQLVEVVKSQTTDAHNQKIEYKVLVKDSVSDFFTKLGNKTLNDINMEEIVTGGTPVTYTSANVVASFNNTITDGYKFLLPDDVDNLYNLKAFHPALYAKTYFDAIFQGAGFTYEWGNQSPNVHTTNDNYFEKLVIPYNGGTPQQDRNDYLVEATKSGSYGAAGLSWTQQVTGFTEVTDLENLFDPTLGDYSVPFNIQNPENVQVEVTINYDIDFINNDWAPAPSQYETIYLQGTLGNVQTRLRTLEQGTSNYYSAFLYNEEAPLVSSVASYSLVSGGQMTVTMPATNLLNTDILEFYVVQSITNSFEYYTEIIGGTLVDTDIDVTINSSTWKILPSSDTIGYQSNLNLNVYVPKKVKQADFIKSIFMMYNLYAEVDPTQPNKFILKSRDDYYDSGAEVDWTAKLAKDSDQTLQFLPELSAKKMVLSYKDDKDEINTIYKEATSETYGQVEFTFENEYVKGIDRKELIFSPTPIVKTTFNAYVPALSWIPETNIRILVDGGTQTCDEFDIYDYYSGSTGVGQTAQTTAPLLTHFDDPVTPSFDLNFAVCDYYFYSDFSQRTNNNLYNLYWRRTLGQIDKGKMLTAFFDLNEVDIQSLKLNDKIRIDNSWWHINRVIDYDANEHKLTKVELISVDEEIEFTPFATSPTIPDNPIQPPVRPVRPVKPTKPQNIRPVKEIFEKNVRASNIINGNALVMGTNNYIGSDVTKAIVLGDNNIVEENKILAPVIEATEKIILPDGSEITQVDNFATADLTFTESRTHSLNGWRLAIESSVDEVMGIADSGVVFNENGADIDFRIEGDTYTSLFSVDAGNDRVGIATTTPNRLFDVNGEAVIRQGLVINENAANSDTRIEGQTDANLVFVDASTNRVGIGTNTPSSKLHVESSASGISRYTRTSTTTDVGYEIGGSTLQEFGLYDYTNSRYRWNAQKDVFVINDSAANYDFRVEGQTDTALFFTDASTDRVGIGTNTPSYKLDVNGDVNVASGSAYYHNGTAGLSGTYTFGGGSTGDIASMTFSGGILTAVTTVP